MDPQEPSPEEVQKKEEQVQQIKAAWKGEFLYYSSIRYRLIIWYTHGGIYYIIYHIYIYSIANIVED